MYSELHAALLELTCCSLEFSLLYFGSSGSREQAMEIGVRIVQWVFISNKVLLLSSAGPLGRGETSPMIPIGWPWGSFFVLERVGGLGPLQRSQGRLVFRKSQRRQPSL